MLEGNTTRAMQTLRNNLDKVVSDAEPNREQLQANIREAEELRKVRADEGPELDALVKAQGAYWGAQRHTQAQMREVLRRHRVFVWNLDLESALFGGFGDDTFDQAVPDWMPDAMLQAAIDELGVKLPTNSAKGQYRRMYFNELRDAAVELLTMDPASRRNPTKVQEDALRQLYAVSNDIAKAWGISLSTKNRGGGKKGGGKKRGGQGQGGQGQGGKKGSGQGGQGDKKGGGTKGGGTKGGGQGGQGQGGKAGGGHGGRGGNGGTKSGGQGGNGGQRILADTKPTRRFWSDVARYLHGGGWKRLPWKSLFALVKAAEALGSVDKPGPGLPSSLRLPDDFVSLHDLWRFVTDLEAGFTTPCSRKAGRIPATGTLTADRAEGRQPAATRSAPVTSAAPPQPSITQNDQQQARLAADAADNSADASDVADIRADALDVADIRADASDVADIRADASDVADNSADVSTPPPDAGDDLMADPQPPASSTSRRERPDAGKIKKRSNKKNKGKGKGKGKGRKHPR